MIANHDVDITIRAGTVHALIGENGAGKSTLMKILYGVQKPDDGTIAVNGEQVTLPLADRCHRHGHRHGVPALPCSPTTSPSPRTSCSAPRSCTASATTAAQEIERDLATYGFGLDPDELVERLGVGDRQRVEILKVLYRGAKIIILDEPTAVLVPQEVDALFAQPA